MRYSNQLESGEQLLSPRHLAELGSMLNTIHSRFSSLYGIVSEEEFAMEVEFKITAEGTLAIKQARPWIF